MPFHPTHDEDGDPLEIALTVPVALSIARVCAGYHQGAAVVVFVSLEPCMCLCFRHANGKHYHLFGDVEDQEAQKVLVATLALNAENTVENILSVTFDRYDEKDRKRLEVTPKRKRKKKT